MKKKRSTYGKIFFCNVKVSLKQQEEHSEIWFSQKYIGFQKQIVGVLRKKKQKNLAELNCKTLKNEVHLTKKILDS